MEIYGLHKEVNFMGFEGGTFIAGFIAIAFYFIILGLSIYAFVLFVKLANRGIMALDIYIEEKVKNKQ